MALFILSGCGPMTSATTGDNTNLLHDNQPISDNTNKLANKRLIIYNYNSDTEIKEFNIKNNDYFSIEFIHSVNKETLKYGDDGSMIIENINKKIDPLTYYLSSIYDHKLRISGGEEISLWDICGKNLIIKIEIK